MQSEKYEEIEIESVFTALAKEQESAWELFTQINHLTTVLWDHYEHYFLEKLRERNNPSSAPDAIELPF